jgi:hypothetical protein
MMCVNCCNNIHEVLKTAAEYAVVSEELGLAEESGYTKIKEQITGDDIQKCRTACQLEYPMETPTIIPPPPRDLDLGKI